MLPALLVLVVGLAITVLGVLLIPFAIVAYVIAAAGLVTLGFLAVARLTGGALASDRGTTSPRGVHLRALVIGLVDLSRHLDDRGAVRVESGHRRHRAAPSPSRSPGSRPRSVSGAALASRAGTQRAVLSSKQSAADEYAWQTPTPVTGVAAATRKVKVGSAGG